LPELPGRILVVDDHEMNRSMLSRRLRRLGHEVDEAGDGDEALTVLRAGGGRHDVLLLDIMMPRMDGYEVLGHLKADPALRDLPVIMISALEDIDSVVRCIELGADDHLPKPFNPTLLQARIGACLEKKRLRDLEKRHARSLERELEIGRTIQAGFLPDELPAVTGWDIAARFRPARQVAGDFYDVFPLRGGRALALVVADVCDKGVGAALFMALCRSLLRATATQRFNGGPPDGDASALGYTVSFVNDYIAGIHGRANMFATVFFGIMDPANGTMLYVNGGHDPPLIAGPEGIRTTLPPTGPAIGLLPGLPFTVARTVLAPGETLLVHTDGVTDARSPGGDAFGDARFSEIATAHSGGSAAALLGAMEAAVSDHSAGAPQFDDVTLLAVKRAGQGAA
jgi:phosphoserine phosphatase RsbU/P